MESWNIELPFPPLNLNEQRRQHWATKRKEIANVREVTGWLVRKARIPQHGRVEVWVTYFPPDRRRRDADNIVATLKPVCDALVDLRVVPDDTPEFMVKHMPIVGPKDESGRGRLLLTVAGLALPDPALTSPNGTRRGKQVARSSRH
jgi:crossover junction endodeoxyribonuclease RusA